MNSSPQRKFIIGLIFIGVIITAFVAIAVIIKLRGKNKGVFTAYTVFNSASGLQSGYKVWLNGVNVGTVETVVILGPSVVRVNMSIDTAYKKYIHRDAIAKLGSEGMMGNGLISISQGNSKEPEINNGDSIHAVLPPDYSKAMKRAIRLGKQFGSLSTEFKAITDQFTKGHGSITTLMNSKSLGTQLKTTVETAKKSITRVKKVMKSAPEAAPAK